MADHPEEDSALENDPKKTEVVLDGSIDLKKLNRLATFVSKPKKSGDNLDDSLGEDSEDEFETSNSFSKSMNRQNSQELDGEDEEKA